MTIRYTESEAAFLPIGEASRKLGVSVDTLRRWETEGRVTSIRTLGNQRRFRIADIDALLAPRSMPERQ